VKKIRDKRAHTTAIDKARGGVEKREYWQTDDISRLGHHKHWTGLKTIVMTRTTVSKNGTTASETRYFISSVPADIEEMARAVRGHRMAESCHWHLDVTFREDANHTADKAAAYNLNIINVSSTR
jgi:hypothetical protein